jgi:hypothetical protein
VVSGVASALSDWSEGNVAGAMGQGRRWATVRGRWGSRESGCQGVKSVRVCDGPNTATNNVDTCAGSTCE